MIAINKADGDNIRGRNGRRRTIGALQILRHTTRRGFRRC
jgi:hypothetical protein